MDDNRKMMSFPMFSEQGYAAAFAAYNELHQEQERLHALAGMIVNGFKQKSLALLSIGAGTGSFEEALIKEYGLSLDYYHAIEPNDDHLKQLESIVSKLNVKYTIDKACFTPQIKIEEKFDMILMSHCLYFIPNAIEAVMHAKSFLKPNGKLLVFHMTEEGPCEVIRRFLSLASLDPPLVYVNNGISLEDVSANLTQNGIHNYIERATNHLDVGNFIAKRDNTAISFLTQTPYENLPQFIQDEIYNLVREKCINPEPGKYLLYHPTAMLVVECS